MNEKKNIFVRLWDKIRSLTPKQIVFIVLCVLLITVVVLTCVVVNKVSRIFSSLVTPPETSAPTQTTTPPTTTVPPTTVPPTSETTQPTYQTEPGHIHEFQLTESVSATCLSYGYNIYTCSCGKQDIPLSEQTEPLGHSYSAGQVIAPTCTEDGYTKSTCYNCGDVKTSNIVAATGHDYELSEEVEGTCGLQAHTVSHCRVCNHELIEFTGELVEHSFEIVEEVAGSCTEEGYTLSKCKNCGQELKENVKPATGHSYSDWTKLPNGSYVRACLHEGCTLSESSNDFTITRDQSGVGHDAGGKQYKLYIIYVGTQNNPELFRYTINDFLDNGTLYYSYHPVHGLVVTYTTDAGVYNSIVKPIFADGEITIQPSETEETVPPTTEPVETTPPTTEPIETEPVETDPVETTPPTTAPVQTDPVETTSPTETTPPTDGSSVSDDAGQNVSEENPQS